MFLDIISITKDDIIGLNNTNSSITKLLTNPEFLIQQIIIDGSVSRFEFNNSNLPNVIHYRNDAHGISNAFNNGIKRSKAKWLWFLNGGDELYSNENGELMLNIISKSTADIVVFQIAYGDQLTVREFPPMWLQWPPISAWMPHPSMIIKRELFNKYGLFDERYKGVMDFDLWLKMTSKNIKIDLISIPLVKFDLNGFSTTHTQHIARECLKSTFRNSPLIFKTFLVRNRLLLSSLLTLIKTSILKQKM